MASLSFSSLSGFISFPVLFVFVVFLLPPQEANKTISPININILILILITILLLEGFYVSIFYSSLQCLVFLQYEPLKYAYFQQKSPYLFFLIKDTSFSLYK